VRTARSSLTFYTLRPFAPFLQAEASISPEAMMHFPLFQIPPISKIFSDSHIFQKFSDSKLYLSSTKFFGFHLPKFQMTFFNS